MIIRCALRKLPVTIHINPTRLGEHDKMSFVLDGFICM